MQENITTIKTIQQQKQLKKGRKVKIVQNKKMSPIFMQNLVLCQSLPSPLQTLQINFYFQKLSIAMAFVYCNDRWKNGKQNDFPGPCQYGGDQESSRQLTHNAASRLLKSIKKPKYEHKMLQKDAQQSFKEMINQRIVQADADGKINQLKSSAKKGKLYRNHSMELKNTKEKFIQQQTQLKIIIKNASHNQQNVGARNKWGNMRIKEMLKEHRQKELKKSALQLYNKENRTVLIQDNREKLKEQLKQLQTILTTHRKGGNTNLHNISKKKITPSNTFLAHAASENKIRFSEPSKEDLQVQPSTVYLSDKNAYDQQCYVRPESYIANETQKSSIIGNSKLTFKQKLVSTGFEEDTNDDDSIEYISDATPGPGAYNLQTQASRVGSKIQKFGVTMQRFKPERVPLTHALTAPVIPQYKVTTNARQEDVGFGRSTKQQRNKLNIAHNGAFYEDYESLQYKSIKTKYKNRKDNLCFDSCQERFPEESKKKLPIQSQSQSQEEPQQIEVIEEKPTSIFLSKVNRELEYITNTTQNADFTGQNFNCIANKIKKQKQHLEDYDLDPAPFLSNSKRFVYKQVKVEQKKQQLLGIKIEELKKRKQIKRRTEEKGFTFSKDAKKDIISGGRSQDMPSPDHYEKPVAWIKPSYNVRFNP